MSKDSKTVNQTDSESAGVLAQALSISRFHIVAIASLGCLTFGWIFFGRYPWLLSAVCALDWFLVNLLNRVVDFEEDRKNRIVGTDFAARHRRPITWFGLSLLVGSLAGIHLLVPAITWLRLAYHALWLAYNWPLLPGKRRIKQLYFFKNTASAAGFMITVFGYPLAAAHADGLPLAAGITPATVIVAALFFFLFELSYEVIYDLRDAEGDAAAQVRSYPVVHGIRGATRIVDGLAGGSVVVMVGGYLAGLAPWHLAIMTAAPVVQIVLYKRALPRGISSALCVGITWLGAAMLLTYHIWILLDLPGSPVS